MANARPRALAPRRPGLLRRLLSDERGTATTETVIMIPMFVIVWGCIVYVTQFFQETHEMRMRLRRDTWAYAYTACQDAPGTNTSVTAENALLPDLSGGSSDGAASDAGGALSIGGAVSTVMSYIPGLNFQTSHGTRSTRITRPNVIGGGAMNMSADLVVLCNERPRGVLSFLWNAVRSAFGL